MKKVLITGIDGFTGVYLEKLLTAAGYDVYGLAYPRSGKRKHLVCDITDRKELVASLNVVRPDFVIHLAGISFVPHSDVSQIYAINYLASINILDALLEIGLRPEKIVLASSANVYGNPSMEVVDESLCPSPISHYAISKLNMEFMARTYFDRLNILITRPFNYTGVGQAEHFLIPKILRHFKDRKHEIELGNTEVARDFSDVRFVAEVYKKLMECPAASESVNICSGVSTSLIDIIRTMNEMAGYEINVVVNPAFIRGNEVITLSGSPNRLFSLIGDMKVYSVESTLRWMFETA